MAPLAWLEMCVHEFQRDRTVPTQSFNRRESRKMLLTKECLLNMVVRLSPLTRGTTVTWKSPSKESFLLLVLRG